MDKCQPDSAQVEQALAESLTLLERRKLKAGVSKLNRLIRSLPPTAPLYEVACVELSAAYQQQGDLRRAIAAMRRAVKASPTNPRYRVSLSIMYRETGSYRSALREARTAVALSPGLLEARELLAEILVEYGLLEKAVSEANAILKLAPNNTRALDLIGTAYLYQGRIHQALRVVERLVRLCPGDPSHHLKRAVLLQQIGCLSDAIESYLRVMEMAPGTDLADQASEAVQMLDEHQLRQIVLLASSDSLFRAKLSRDAVAACQERGYHLSPDGASALMQIRFDSIPQALMEWHYRTYN
jgi:tetratricopeptide (TPR) repeat protein